MEKISQKEFSSLLLQDAYKNDIPAIGDFEITPLCNLDCRMCYVHLQDSTTRHRMLNGVQWKSIIQSAVAEGMISATLTGGEAMTHPDFWDIYDCLIQQGVITSLKSNGILLNETNVERLKRYPPSKIDISLYGCDRESYMAVTGRDVFDVVTANITRVIESGIHLRLAITPSAYMLPWVEQVMAYAGTFGVKVIVGSLLIDAGDDTGREKTDFDLTVEDSLRIQRRARELFPPEHKSKGEKESPRTNAEKRADVSDKGLHCNAGRAAFAVNWDGTMGPCLSFSREIICAHPLRDGFAAAWKEVNDGIKNYAVPEKCHKCSINTKCHYCPTQHGKYAHSHQCDDKVCAFYQGFYKEFKAGD